MRLFAKQYKESVCLYICMLVNTLKISELNETCLYEIIICRDFFLLQIFTTTKFALI